MVTAPRPRWRLRPRELGSRDDSHVQAPIREQSKSGPEKNRARQRQDDVSAADEPIAQVVEERPFSAAEPTRDLLLQPRPAKRRPDEFTLAQSLCKSPASVSTPRWLAWAAACGKPPQFCRRLSRPICR